MTCPNNDAEQVDAFVEGVDVANFNRSFARSGISQAKDDRILALRANNPFVPIFDFPFRSNAVVLDVASAKNIDIPQDASYVIFSGNDDYYVTINGQAVIPGADILDGNAPIFRPDNMPLYCYNLRSVSLIAPRSNTVVTAAFYFTT